MADSTCLDGDSDTESFVDALEDLQLTEEKPVEFVDSRASFKHITSDCSSAKSDIHEEYTEEAPSRVNANEKSSKNDDDQSDEHSSRDEEDKERPIDDLIKEATVDGPTTPTETSGEYCEDDNENDAEEAARKETEEAMTEDERQAKREEAQLKKLEGNERFKDGNYQGALESYTDALMLCPLEFTKDRSIMFSNRAATKYKLERYETAIADCTKALELNPVYLKALLRRAELYEKVDKLDEALADYTKALEMDRTLVKARIACQTLPDRIKERNEKLKEEMLDKLKDLGNLILRPFGLSTNNFKLQQDPNTGSYSVQFQQAQTAEPSNGK